MFNGGGGNGAGLYSTSTWWERGDDEIRATIVLESLMTT